MTPDYYALLNVVPDADREIIRAAYLVLAKRYHPDTATAASPHDVEKFQLLTKAYEVLRDPNRRALYDWHHARQKRGLAQREKFENARRRAREQARRKQGERSQEEQEHQEARARAKSRSPSALRNPLIFSVGGFALAALVFGLIKAPGSNNLATNSDPAMHTEKFEPSSSLLSDKTAENPELTELRQALQQAQTAAAASQESLAQERARSLALEEQLAARQDATPGRGRNAPASPSDTPDPTQAPATDKPATAPLPTSDKPMTQGGDRPATMAGEADGAGSAQQFGTGPPDGARQPAAGPGQYRRGPDRARARRRDGQRAGAVRASGDVRSGHPIGMGNLRDARRCWQGTGTLCQGVCARHSGGERSIERVALVKGAGKHMRPLDGRARPPLRQGEAAISFPAEGRAVRLRWRL